LNRTLIKLFGAVLLAISTFPHPAHAVTIEWAPVGDVGNAASSISRGAVDHPYQIAKYDVTIAQYVEFLNAKDPSGANPLGLYNSKMSSNLNVAGITFNSAGTDGSKYTVMAGHENQPITYVSFFDTIRFTNWLNNGQGNADTETGSYTLTGGTPKPANFDTMTRNANATIVLPTEDEWYKAAFSKGGGLNAGYWTYATQSNAVPTSAPPSPTATNSANYDAQLTGFAVTGAASQSATQDYLTDVGTYGNSASAYGTFDQNGDVYQWNESLYSTFRRGTRGGSWFNGSDHLRSTYPSNISWADPTVEIFDFGFRVAQVPEPLGLSAWALGGLALLRRRTRKS
jgi:sulfatase modifying factor 1